MKILNVLFPALLLFSCFNGSNEKVDDLDQRINRLERRMDSLTGGSNAYSSEPGNINNLTNGAPFFTTQAGRCQKITKKGTQCRRKAKANGYCWQHGG